MSLDPLSRRLVIVGALLFVLASDHRSLAGEGVLEINQACAKQTGCFPGDSAGFPVTITQPGSYRLTGNLDMTAESYFVSAVAVQVSDVTLDLGGFEIAGPNTCTGSGPTLQCALEEGMVGVLLTGSDGTTVRNGTIRGMTAAGVAAIDSDAITVEGLTVTHNGLNGIKLENDSIVRGSIASENEYDGIKLVGGLVRGCMLTGNSRDGVESVLDVAVTDSVLRGNGVAGVRSGGAAMVSDNVTAANGTEGFQLAVGSRYGRNVSRGNGQPDTCGGGICSERRRYYLTQTSPTGSSGDAALDACAAGFHMASLWEIFDTSMLAYDSVLGLTNDDSGAGPPTGSYGYVRTGNTSNNTTPSAGTSNCLAWSDSSGYGTMLSLEKRWYVSSSNPQEPAQATIIPWRASNTTCIVPGIHVWCVEDD